MITSLFISLIFLSILHISTYFELNFELLLEGNFWEKVTRNRIFSLVLEFSESLFINLKEVVSLFLVELLRSENFLGQDAREVNVSSL